VQFYVCVVPSPVSYLHSHRPNVAEKNVFSSDDTNVHTNAEACNSFTTNQGSNQTSKHASVVPLLLLPREVFGNRLHLSLFSQALTRKFLPISYTKLFLLSSKDNVSLKLLKTNLSENKQASETEQSAKHTQASKETNKRPNSKSFELPTKTHAPGNPPKLQNPQNTPPRPRTPGRDPAPRPPRPKSSQKLQNSQPSENKKT
jgi:hypothetical protein